MMLRRIMWRNMKKMKVMNVDVAEDEVEVDDVVDHEAKEEEDDDVKDDHVEAQDGTHTFVRACAVKNAFGHVTRAILF